jgi:hypothetical protein
VLYSHAEVYGVFIQWTSSSRDSFHYVAINWWGHANPDDYKDSSKIWRIDHVNSNGATRVKPIDERYMEDNMLECLANVKKLMLK